MNYEELLGKVPHSLRGKIEHSAELLRKAEKLAKKRKKKAQGVNITNATEERTLGCISGRRACSYPRCSIGQRTTCGRSSTRSACRTARSTMKDGIGLAASIARWHRAAKNCVKMNGGRTLSGIGLRLSWLYAGGGIRKRTYLPQRKDRPRQVPDMGSGVRERENIGKRMAQKNEQRPMGGFSDGASSDGYDEAREREIAENIYEWWISGKSYKKWYAEKFQQLHIDFGE